MFGHLSVHSLPFCPLFALFAFSFFLVCFFFFLLCTPNASWSIFWFNFCALFCTDSPNYFPAIAWFLSTLDCISFVFQFVFLQLFRFECVLCNATGDAIRCDAMRDLLENQFETNFTLNFSTQNVVCVCFFWFGFRKQIVFEFTIKCKHIGNRCSTIYTLTKRLT